MGTASEPETLFITQPATPDAPPAAECAVREVQESGEALHRFYGAVLLWVYVTADKIFKTLRDDAAEIENHCPCGARPESLQTHPHVAGCPVARLLGLLSGASSAAALAAPCSEGLRAELEGWKEEFGTDNPELAKLESTNFGASEMVRVILDLESPGVIGHPKAQLIREMLRSVDGLRAELAKAVDALRPFHEWVKRYPNPKGSFVHEEDEVYEVSDIRMSDVTTAATIVTAYDAKHGKKL